MSDTLTVLVSDTSPLLTLALGDSLDALLRLGVPIVIPDAVYIEATRIVGAPGAMQIVAWLDEHPQARVAMTEIGIDQQLRLKDSRSIRGMGEARFLNSLRKFSIAARRRKSSCFTRTAISRRSDRGSIRASNSSRPASS